MGNESINIGPGDKDLIELKTISKEVPTSSSGAEIDVGTNGTAGNTIIEFVSIYLNNRTNEPIQYELIYNASYSLSGSTRMACVVVNPYETVVICKKSQPIYGSTRNFYDHASQSGIRAIYSYKRYGS